MTSSSPAEAIRELKIEIEVIKESASYYRQKAVTREEEQQGEIIQLRSQVKKQEHTITQLTKEIERLKQERRQQQQNSAPTRIKIKKENENRATPTQQAVTQGSTLPGTPQTAQAVLQGKTGKSQQDTPNSTAPSRGNTEIENREAQQMAAGQSNVPIASVHAMLEHQGRNCPTDPKERSENCEVNRMMLNTPAFASVEDQQTFWNNFGTLETARLILVRDEAIAIPNARMSGSPTTNRFMHSFANMNNGLGQQDKAMPHVFSSTTNEPPIRPATTQSSSSILPPTRSVRGLAKTSDSIPMMSNTPELKRKAAIERMEMDIKRSRSETFSDLPGSFDDGASDADSTLYLLP